MRPSIGALLSSLALGMLDAAAIAAALTAILIAVFSVARFAFSLSIAVTAALFVLSYCGVAIYRMQGWRRASMRVTTERILLQSPGGLLARPLITIKWARYQESALARAKPLDLLLRTRTLVVRYGTAGGEREARYNALPMGRDIKHFLDKVDAAVRQGTQAQLRPFIAKPRGQRDAL